MIYKIVKPFINNLTAYDKHYLLNRDNLTQPIQIQLAQKENSFTEFVFAFLKIYIKF